MPNVKIHEDIQPETVDYAQDSESDDEYRFTDASFVKNIMDEYPELLEKNRLGRYDTEYYSCKKSTETVCVLDVR